MADGKSLRLIGFGLSAIAAAASFVAVMLVADATNSTHRTASAPIAATQ